MLAAPPSCFRSFSVSYDAFDAPKTKWPPYASSLAIHASSFYLDVPIYWSILRIYKNNSKLVQRHAWATKVVVYYVVIVEV